MSRFYFLRWEACGNDDGYLQACVPRAVPDRLQAALGRRAPISVQTPRSPWEVPPHARELRSSKVGSMSYGRAGQYSYAARLTQRGGPEKCPTGRSEPRAPSANKRIQEAFSKMRD